MSSHYEVPERPAGEVKPCVDGGEKCGSCGCTLLSEIDKQLHRCEAWIRSGSWAEMLMRMGL